MSKQIIKTDKAPLPIGPYNQATVVGNLVFVSGQIPLDLKTGQIIEGSVKDQTKLVLEHLQNVLSAAGSSFEKVLKATVFLKDMNDFLLMNEVYSQYFKAETAPARSTIQVARLPKDARVEIEVIASI